MEIAVDLWLWRLDGAPEAPLQPDEEARAARFLRAADASAFRAARAGLRRALAGYTGTPAAGLTFAYGPDGKPALPQGPAFNLSHSGGWAALAVAPAEPALPLGIDIEAHGLVEPGVPVRFFSPPEVAALAPLTGAAWDEAFFRIWTRKEAFTKALGTGLTHPLASFDVTAGPEARLTRLAGGEPARWTLLDLPLGPRFAGAIAARSDGRPLRLTLRAGVLPLPA